MKKHVINKVNILILKKISYKSMKNEIHTFAGVQLRLACEKMMAHKDMRSLQEEPRLRPLLICHAAVFFIQWDLLSGAGLRKKNGKS